MLSRFFSLSSVFGSLIIVCFVAKTVKNLPCSAGDPGLIPGLGRSLEKGMVTHSSILAWRIPWTEEPVGCSPRGQSQTGVSSHACIHLSPHPLSVYMQTERDIDTDASLLGGCSGPTGRTAWRTPAAGPPAPARSSPLSQPPVPSVTEADELGVWLRL